MTRANSQPIPIALDVSCAAEIPLTGIGYAAIYQVRALLALPQTRFAFSYFAAGARRGTASLLRELGNINVVSLPYARLAKYYLWTSLAWPPLEYFTGPARIAHNFSHQTPATSKALKLVTIHDMSVYRHPETHTPRTVDVQKTLLEDCARRADFIVAVSESCKMELCDILNIDSGRVHVIHNGVDTSEFDMPFDEARLAFLRNQNGIRDDYLIHIGTIEPRKNIQRLLAAYRALRGRRRTLPQLVFVGAKGWNADAILDDMNSLGPDLVRPGYLSRADLVLLLRGAVACVYPSLYEGFGLPVLEAMAARTPVLTSKTTSLPEVAGDAAIYADPLNIDSIAHGIDRILDDPAGARARAELGRARAEALSWNASAAQLASLYESLAN